jgi:hypothetical protein
MKNAQTGLAPKPGVWGRKESVLLVADMVRETTLVSGCQRRNYEEKPNQPFQSCPNFKLWREIAGATKR